MSEYPTETNAVTPTRRPVKVTYLVIGLLYVGIAGIWLLGATDTIAPHDAAMGFPGVLIAAGVIGLVASLANSRTRTRRQPVVHPTETPSEPISEEESP